MRDGEEWLEITIGNISSSGLMVKSPVTPPIGTNVEIRRRGAVIIGEIVWAARARFGLKSSQPIDVGALTAGSGLDTNKNRHDEPARNALWHWRERS